MRSTRTPRRSHWLRRGGGIALLTVMFGMAVATPASAHPYLLSSTPAAGAILATAPADIDINYTEGLDRSYCSVVLIGPDGHHISTHQVHAGAATQLAVAPDAPLAEQGTYAVNWTAVGDDGHTVIGTFGFSVGHPSANAAVSVADSVSAGGTSAVGGVQRILRALLPFATVVFAGLLLLVSGLLGAGRPSRRIVAASFAAEAGLVLALMGDDLANGGWSRFVDSQTGARLIAELALTVVAALALRASRVRRALAPLVAVGLVFVLALSGHASSQPESRRTLAIAVYTVHLLAVSVWLAALVLVIVVPERRRSLRGVAVGSLLAVLITGVATTDWGLRTLHDLPDTTYGKLAITLFALFVVVVAVGALGARWRWSHPAEGVVAAGALVVAGVLGGIAQPLDQPYPSQVFAADAGLSVAAATDGSSGLDVGLLAPGIVGANSLVIDVGHSDQEDFVSPVTDVRSVTATISCGGCGAPDRSIALRPTGKKRSWTAPVAMTVPASYLVKLAITSDNGTRRTVSLAERVSPAKLSHQIVVGVPADFSGASGETCRDQVVGMQVAFNDLNTTAADHGDLIRVVAVDLRHGSSAAVAQLRAAGARMIAMPCGTPADIDGLMKQADAAGLPVVLGSTTATVAGAWSTQPSWSAEGTAIAEQAITQGADAITAVAGPTSIDRAELSGLRAGLAAHHLSLTVHPFPADPDAFVDRLARGSSDAVVLLGDPAEASPLVHAFSAAENTVGWEPSHGILASAQLMSTDFINAAGTITRLGGIEFASDINPFDPVSQYYAQRLRSLVPGIRPSFDGLHGYEAGLAIGQALRDGGGDPSSSRLASLFGSDFHDFTVGSYRLGWQADGGTSTSLAFFRSTYVNPMALPSNTPGGASALAHEGTFLNTGGFEQVAPFRTLR